MRHARLPPARSDLQPRALFGVSEGDSLREAIFSTELFAHPRHDNLSNANKMLKRRVNRAAFLQKVPDFSIRYVVG